VGGAGAVCAPLYDYIYLHLLTTFSFVFLPTTRRDDDQNDVMTGERKPFGHFYLDWDAQRSGMGAQVSLRCCFFDGIWKGVWSSFVSWGVMGDVLGGDIIKLPFYFLCRHEGDLGGGCRAILRVV
jgi:hypothetical protein